MVWEDFENETKIYRGASNVNMIQVITLASDHPRMSWYGPRLAPEYFLGGKLLGGVAGEWGESGGGSELLRASEIKVSYKCVRCRFGSSLTNAFLRSRGIIRAFSKFSNLAIGLRNLRTLSKYFDANCYASLFETKILSQNGYGSLLRSVDVSYGVFIRFDYDPNAPRAERVTYPLPVLGRMHLRKKSGGRAREMGRNCGLDNGRGGMRKMRGVAEEAWRRRTKGRGGG